MGEQVAAWVVIDSKAVGQQSESDVLAAVKTYAREHLANYKTPKHIWAIDQLPRNPSGKILKKVLREKSSELDPSADAEQTLLRTTVTPQLREKLAAAYPSEAHRVTQTYLQNVICPVLTIQNRFGSQNFSADVAYQRQLWFFEIDLIGDRRKRSQCRFH